MGVCFFAAVDGRAANLQNQFFAKLELDAQ